MEWSGMGEAGLDGMGSGGMGWSEVGWASVATCEWSRGGDDGHCAACN